MTFAKTYKQADLTLTGTMRKAQLAATATKTSRRTNLPGHAESPALNALDYAKRRASSISTLSNVFQPLEEKVKQCSNCRVKFSPKWWSQKSETEEEILLCHKCHWRVNHVENDVNIDGGETEAIGKVIPEGLGGQDSRIGIVV